MWQLLLTGLVAGSSAFIAKHIFTNPYSQIEKCEEEENLQESTPAATALFHSSPVADELCFCLKKRTTCEFVAARGESCSSEDLGFLQTKVRVLTVNLIELKKVMDGAGLVNFNFS
ncbi:hypothetical protein OIU79_028389 [Salix purpurea]|uniref:Uncharacterized protein n=1 Tax=Salix purpurea TaxID=77065 RepID=A0A9Q1A2X1_SALPP|nr:hypothetical protein OIU79_028389 [Salix purpurea]